MPEANFQRLKNRYFHFSRFTTMKNIGEEQKGIIIIINEPSNPLLIRSDPIRYKFESNLYKFYFIFFIHNLYFVRCLNYGWLGHLSC